MGARVSANSSVGFRYAAAFGGRYSTSEERALVWISSA